MERFDDTLYNVTQNLDVYFTSCRLKKDSPADMQIALENFLQYELGLIDSEVSKIQASLESGAILPSREIILAESHEIAERFALAPIRLLTDYIELRRDEKSLGTWYNRAIEGVLSVSSIHTNKDCFEDTAYLYGPGCCFSSLCPRKELNEVLVAPATIFDGRRELELRINPARCADIIDMKLWLAEVHGLITPATRDALMDGWVRTYKEFIPESP